MERDEYEIPVTREQVCRAGEVCARFNPEPGEHVARKHDATHHQENRAQKDPAIHDRLQDAECVVAALEQRKEESPVQRDVHRPQNKQHHAQNLVNGSRFKEVIAAHQYERRDCHRDIKRHTDFGGNRHIKEYTLFRLHAVFLKPLCHIFREARTAGVDNFIESLIASDYGEGIARDWAVTGARDKKNQLTAYVVGLLKDGGVLKGSYVAIGNKTGLNNKERTFSTNMSRGKKQPYAEWVKDYVSGTENVSKTE